MPAGEFPAGPDGPVTRALVDSGLDVVVAAPDRDMSGSGAAIGHIHMDEHIDAKPVDLPGLAGVPAYAVDGPPGLCVLAARLGGFGPTPDLVVSGINPGCNTGRAVLHSGTVGAALTAANFGCRGIAVSIDVATRLVHETAARAVTPVVDGGEAAVEVVEAPDDASASAHAGTVRDPGSPCHGSTAADAAAAAVGWLVDAPPCTVLNLNVPDLPAEELAGARAATLAPFGTVRSTVVESAESGGPPPLQLRRTDTAMPPHCDTPLLAARYVAVSALTGVHPHDPVDVARAPDPGAGRAPGTP